jgi:hypothetical protein
MNKSLNFFLKIYLLNKNKLSKIRKTADVAELVDALGLGSSNFML